MIFIINRDSYSCIHLLNYTILPAYDQGVRGNGPQKTKKKLRAPPFASFKKQRQGAPPKKPPEKKRGVAPAVAAVAAVAGAGPLQQQLQQLQQGQLPAPWA